MVLMGEQISTSMTILLLMIPSQHMWPLDVGATRGNCCWQAVTERSHGCVESGYQLDRWLDL